MKHFTCIFNASGSFLARGGRGCSLPCTSQRAASMQCSLTAGAAGAWRSRPPPKGGVRLDAPTSALLFSSRKSKLFERTSSSLVTFQNLELQNLKHLAQPNLGTMGEKVGPAPSLSTCCWTLLRCSQWRKGWLWAWLVTGATGSRLR